MTWNGQAVEFVEVVNWREFQHYHTGRKSQGPPPWVKFYHTLLEDYEFTGLTDASKGHLCLLFLVAAKTSNRIPADEAWLQRTCKTDKPVRLKPLLRAGFLQVYTNGSGGG